MQRNQTRDKRGTRPALGEGYREVVFCCLLLTVKAYNTVCVQRRGMSGSEAVKQRGSKAMRQKSRDAAMKMMRRKKNILLSSLQFLHHSVLSPQL